MLQTTPSEPLQNPPQESADTLLKKLAGKPFAAALDALRRLFSASPEPPEEPSHLPQEELLELPHVFQIRDQEVAERHVVDLMKVLSIHKTIDPIKVWRCGHAVIVIDGHHRLEAYRRWNRKAPVPVSFFRGNVEQAIEFAEAANNKAKLSLTLRERTNYAWKLVVNAEKLGNPSKVQIIKRSNIGKGTVDNMRKVFKGLGPRAAQFTEWKEALEEWQRTNTGEAREIDEAWLEAQAMAIVDRLGATYGKTLAKRPEVTAKAFSHLLGRKAPEIALMMLEEYGLSVTLWDHEGNEVEDLEAFEPRPAEENDIPF